MEAHGAIGIVGGGAAATFLLHSLASGPARDRPVVVVDPNPRLGPGVAYGTADPAHLMNVCRVRLSVDGDNGADLIGWLERRGIDPLADTYLQRSMYGDYLEEAAAKAVVGLDVDHRRSRVHAAEPAEGGGWLLRFDDGSTATVADLILATGFPGRPELPCPAPVGDPRIVLDPWRPGAFDGDVQRVVVIGTGLTMVDVVLSVAARHPDAEIVAVSRRGLVPCSSRPGVPQSIDPALLPEPGADARTIVRRVIELGRATDDWQAVIDTVRPRANDLWRGLGHGDQARMLRRWFPWWNVHRHRTAPAIGARLDELRTSGQLRIARGRVVGVADEGAGLRVGLAGRGGANDLAADLVVGAAGPAEDLTNTVDPLLRGLLDGGHAVVGPHRLGIGVDRAGRVRGRDGLTPGLWVLGALRRGTEWETTAVPELRAQAGVITDLLAGGDDRPWADVGVGRC